MAGPTDLFDLAQEFLTAAAQALHDAPAGPIVYQAVTPSSPTFDCPPSLFVHVPNIAPASTLPGSPALASAQRIATSGQVNMVAMTCTIVRCAVTLQKLGQNMILPSAAQITADAAMTYGDVWAVWNFVKNEYREKRLFLQPPCRELAFISAYPIRAEGGAIGWEFTIAVDLGGYGTLTS